LQLELKGVSDLPKVYVDRDRIIQVLINLLSNAIKFTPAKGKIIIESKIFKKCTEEKFIKDTEETFVMISVKDTGFGIPATQKNTLFARHKSQQEISSYNTLPSTGLGLPIAKQIVEMHGGDIWAESQLGYGSRFTFIVPCRRQSGIKGIKPDGSIIPKSILIIDDEKMVREFLGRELEKKGYMVAIARDGLEGLQKALEHYYDLVITDVRMPNIDAINCIKILKRINPNVFFIVITGFSTEQDLKEMLKQHNYPCLKKPFDLPEFLTTVEKVCSVSV